MHVPFRSILICFVVLAGSATALEAVGAEEEARLRAEGPVAAPYAGPVEPLSDAYPVVPSVTDTVGQQVSPEVDAAHVRHVVSRPLSYTDGAMYASAYSAGVAGAAPLMSGDNEKAARAEGAAGAATNPTGAPEGRAAPALPDALIVVVFGLLGFVLVARRTGTFGGGSRNGDTA